MYIAIKCVMNLLAAGQKRGRGRGPSIKFGGVSVNPKTLLATEKELEPLDTELPSNAQERAKWTFPFT